MHKRRVPIKESLQQFFFVTMIVFQVNILKRDKTEAQLETEMFVPQIWRKLFLEVSCN